MFPPSDACPASSMMLFFRHRPALLPLVVQCRRVLAFPLSYTSTVTAKTYIPLIVISISLLFLVVVFLAMKLVYMKHRRIGTIHAPPGAVRSIPTGGSNLSSSISSFGLRDKQGNRHRGLLVGCLGSPTWETNLASRLDGATWRRGQRWRSSFLSQLHTGSTIRSTRSASARSNSKNLSSSSRLTKSTALTSHSSDADLLVLPSLSSPSRNPTPHGGSFSKALCSVQRHTSTDFHLRYGDFGESHGARSPGGGVPNVARRASPSSIRLVDGPSHSNQVEYSFLSGLPPNALVASPPMGARDSFQLSRCSLRCDPKPVPPLPPLPSFLPFYLPNGPETPELHPPRASEYLPPLHFSPLASVAKVFYSQQQVVEKKMPTGRVSDPDGSKNLVWSRVPCFESTSSASSKAQHASNAGSLTSSSVDQETSTLQPIRKTNVKSNHKRSQSCRGLAIGGSSPRTTLLYNDVAAALSSLPLEDKRCSEIQSIPTGVLRTPSGSSRDGSVISKKPLKSCLRQNSVVPTPLVCSPEFTLTPSMSETSTQTDTLATRRSTVDQASLRTPISDVDIGILGLDRFRWNDEIKELKVRSSHMKKDSVALVPYWE